MYVCFVFIKRQCRLYILRPILPILSRSKDKAGVPLADNEELDGIRVNERILMQFMSTLIPTDFFVPTD